MDASEGIISFELAGEDVGKSEGLAGFEHGDFLFLREGRLGIEMMCEALILSLIHI